MDRKQHTESSPRVYSCTSCKEGLGGPDASSHAECPETRVLICKASLRLLSNQQTGCWLCSKQACKLLAAECWAADARSSHSMGTAPRAQWQICIPRHTLRHAADPPARPASEAHAQDADTLLWYSTQAPLFRNTSCIKGSRMSWVFFFLPGLERKASW